MATTGLTDYSVLLKQLREERADSLNVSPNSRILIVDGTNSFIRCFVAIPSLNDDGLHFGGTYGFLKSVGAVIRQFHVSRCIVVFDGKGGSTKRKKIFPEYKEGRTMSTRFNRVDITDATEDQEMQSMKRQYVRLANYLANLPITTISVDNIEADDVISYLTTDIFKTSDIIIMSDDKDFLQLVQQTPERKVNVWRPVEKRFYEEKEVYERFKIPACNFLIYKIFIGDSSDNIGGIDGIGPGKLVKMFPMLQETRVVSVEEILTHCEANKTKGKLYSSIIDQKDKLIRNSNLMQLHNVDISGTIKLNINALATGNINTLNRFAIKKLYVEDRAFTIIPNLDSWMTSTFNHLNSCALMKNQ